MHIPAFLIPIFVGTIIQTMKIIIDRIKWDKITFDKIFTAGGFPSVHSGLSTSLLVTVYYIDGIFSGTFAITIIFSILFWYDAMNIRYQAGKHAQVINNMRSHLSNVFELEYSPKVMWKLKERLGHTFSEVLWWIIISWILTYFLIIYLEAKWIFIYIK